MAKGKDLNVVYKRVEDLIPYARNARTHSDEQIAQVAASIKEFGFTNPILIDGENGIIAGHGRLMAARKLGLEKVPTIELSHLSPTQKRAYILADNRLAEKSGWDSDLLSLEIEELKDLDFDLAKIGFDDYGFSEDVEGSYKFEEGEKNSGILSEKYLEPPFSILDTTSGRWQERVRAWKDLGIRSELGRDENLIGYAGMIQIKNHSSTSVFDPVLCEIAYSWFSAKGANVVDPFAGGSVRGIIASKLGRNYFGNDLREEQVIENRKQASDICQDPLPIWSVGDSQNIRKLIKGIEADFIFSCPPYADLEVYSDNPKDISTMEYDDFLKVYRYIIAESCAMLKPNRFACFVVGEVRDKKGIYRNFVGDTIQAFLDAGLSYYNEMILVNFIGSLPLRAEKTFKASRKIAKRHQNVLVFVKGDAKKATEYCGDVDLLGFEEYERETSDELPN